MTDIGRVRDLTARMTGDEKHDAAATSTLDVLHVLYERVLRVDPARPDDPERDRFLLSKGHGPMAYYAVLAARGFLDPGELAGWTRADSRLGYHPDRVLVPGVEIGSGSLGHGLPLAVGTTLGLRARGLTGPRVVVLVGDAELDEGSNHEAITLAGRRGLDALTCVVVDNGSATHGWPAGDAAKRSSTVHSGIADRFVTEGWRTITVDGHDHDALELALTAPHDGRPLAVVARVTRKDGTS